MCMLQGSHSMRVLSERSHTALCKGLGPQVGGDVGLMLLQATSYSIEACGFTLHTCPLPNSLASAVVLHDPQHSTSHVWEAQQKPTSHAKD